MAKMSTTTATKPANAGGNKSVPAPVITVSMSIRRWFLLVIIALAVLGGIARIASVVRSGHQQSVMLGTVAPIGECTKSSPCIPFKETDGPTKKVALKEGRSLCFDSSFFKNLPRLGYATSYEGGPEMKPGCTTASCTMDTFWFTPEAGVNLPKYWFVPEGSSQC